MKRLSITNCFFAIVLFSAGALAAAPEQSPPAGVSSERNPDHQPNMETKKIGLAIHGGAGTIERSNMTPEREREYRVGLQRALTAGYEILKRGGSSLDATEAAVRVRFCSSTPPRKNGSRKRAMAITAAGIVAATVWPAFMPR